MAIRTIFRMLVNGARATVTDYADLQLLNAIRKNDQEAFRVIFDRYWAPLYDFVFVRVQSVDRSREIVQDVFVCLWEQRELLSKIKLKSYLYADANARSVNFLAEPLKNSLPKKGTSKTLIELTQP
jgi:hypothetical protein